MGCEDGKDDSAYVWNSEKLQHDIFHYALERVVYDGAGGYKQVIKSGEQADVYNETDYRQNFMGLFFLASRCWTLARVARAKRRANKGRQWRVGL